jgi:F-type H+-transporting ATPase subunit a
VFASGFTIFNLVPAIDRDTLLAPIGIHHETSVVFMAWTVALILIGGAIIARMGLEAAKSRPGLDKYHADTMPTPRTLAEVYGSAILGLVTDILGPVDGPVFFPYLAALFIYIFTSNAIGLIPGFLPPTDNVNTNVSMAIISFLLFNFVGLSRDPVGYIKHLLGPVAGISPSKDLVPFLLTGFVAPLLFVIETFGLLLRPFTLTVRLTANMTGDHMVFSTMSHEYPVLIPVIFLAFGLFVSFIQAYVFTLLTTIYVSLAKPHEHEHDEHADHGDHADHADHDHAGHDHAHAH